MQGPLDQGFPSLSQSISLRERELSLRVEDYEAQLGKTAECPIDCLLTDSEPTAHVRWTRQAPITHRFHLVEEEQDLE